jgi:hypothetical protein
MVWRFCMSDANEDERIQIPWCEATERELSEDWKRQMGAFRPATLTVRRGDASPEYLAEHAKYMEWPSEKRAAYERGLCGGLVHWCSPLTSTRAPIGFWGTSLIDEIISAQQQYLDSFSDQPATTDASGDRSSRDGS